jgi:hypothetical protein
MVARFVWRQIGEPESDPVADVAGGILALTHEELAALDAELEAQLRISAAPDEPLTVDIQARTISFGGREKLELEILVALCNAVSERRRGSGADAVMAALRRDTAFIEEEWSLPRLDRARFVPAPSRN